jgi:chromosomal replication initiation ATPase DnaA
LFDRDHSTVIAACQVIEQRMARETAFRIFMARLEQEISRAVPATAEAA